MVRLSDIPLHRKNHKKSQEAFSTQSDRGTSSHDLHPLSKENIQQSNSAALEEAETKDKSDMIKIDYNKINISAHPIKAAGPEYDSMAYLAPHASFLFKLVLSNLWIFKDIVSSVLSGNYELDAIQRTTTAVTIINAGFKENVIPSFGTATINHQIHPTEVLDDVLEHDRKVMNDDRVKIRNTGYFAPPPISSYYNDAIAFQTIANSALKFFHDGHITPGTLIANTDTKHYLHLTDHDYRFSPALIRQNDTKRFHGFNDKISVDNFAQIVEFYHRLIINENYEVEQNVSDPFSEGSGECDGVKNLEQLRYHIGCRPN